MTTPAQPPQEPQSSTMRFGDLKKLIQDTVEALTGGQRPNDPPARREPSNARERVRDSRQNMDDEVSKALAKIEADKKRQEREKKLDTDIEELKERTKERPPVERSRLHKFMGWGE